MHITTRESSPLVATAPQSPDCQGGDVAELVHTMRVEAALALGGLAVFCTCGGLTGFAATDHDAQLVHAEHVRRAAERARELEPATWTTPADGLEDGGRPYTWQELAAADEHVAETLDRRRRARRALMGDDAA